MARPLQSAMLAGVGTTADAPLASIAILATAIAAHAIASAMLVAGFPDFAVLHAYAAFVVLSVVAAVHQLVPVLFDVRPMAVPVTLAVAATFLVGFALVVCGFCGLPTMGLAVPVLGFAATLWVATTLERLLQARTERLSAWAVATAVLAFAVAATFALVMLERWPGAFPGWMPRAHGALMLMGFASVMIVALSFRFVPMFALAHGDRYRARIVSVAPAAVAIVVAARGLERIAFALLLAAMLLLALEHLHTLRARIRKRLDMSLKYAIASWALGMVAMLTAMLFPLAGKAVVALALMGWISITICGYAMKIVGFLSWQVARERGVRELVPLSAAIPEGPAVFALVALCVGSVLFAFSNMLFPGIETASAAIYLLGSLVFAWVAARIASRYVIAKGAA